MILNWRKLADGYVISLPDRLGQGRASMLWADLKPLLARFAPKPILDMTQISRLDWSGAALLMDACVEARRMGGTLGVLHAQPAVAAFLELTQIDRLVRVLADENDAREFLAAPPSSDSESALRRIRAAGP